MHFEFNFYTILFTCKLILPIGARMFTISGVSSAHTFRLAVLLTSCTCRPEQLVSIAFYPVASKFNSCRVSPDCSLPVPLTYDRNKKSTTGFLTLLCEIAISAKRGVQNADGQPKDGCARRYKLAHEERKDETSTHIGLCHRLALLRLDHISKWFLC